MNIFTAVKVFSGELLACCASLFKRGVADVERGIEMVFAKTTLSVKGCHDMLVLSLFILPVLYIV